MGYNKKELKWGTILFKFYKFLHIVISTPHQSPKSKGFSAQNQMKKHTKCEKKKKKKRVGERGYLDKTRTVLKR